MKLTSEELRKVYVEAAGAFEAANLGASGIDAGLLAVARYVEQKVREQEPTMEMEAAAAVLDQDDNFFKVYRAMQSVAPSVVPE